MNVLDFAKTFSKD